MPFGAIAKNNAITARRIIDLRRNVTRYGICGFKMIITIGNVINIATPNDVRSEAETTIGIGLIQN